MTRTEQAQARRERAKQILLDLIHKHITSGLKCPTNDEFEYTLSREVGLTTMASSVIAELALEGRIVLELYASNWRVVGIPGVGKTALPPGAVKPPTW